VAHIYLNNRSLLSEVEQLLSNTAGIEQVLGGAEKAGAGLSHPRAGDLVAVASPRAWFTYYYWVEDQRAPDFARTVDIHRKPGYDPVELFLDPQQKGVRLKIALRLLQKKLGFRMLMNVIPLDASLVKGSHGRVAVEKPDRPLLIADHAAALTSADLDSTTVHRVICETILGP
jgi:hypothetical protein